MSIEAGGICTVILIVSELATIPLLSVSTACTAYEPGAALGHTTLQFGEVLVPSSVAPWKTWIDVILLPPGIAVPVILTADEAISCPLVGPVMVMTGAGLPTSSKSKLMSELVVAA